MIAICGILLSVFFVVSAAEELVCVCRNPFPLFDNPVEQAFGTVVANGKTRSIVEDMERC